MSLLCSLQYLLWTHSSKLLILPLQKNQNPITFNNGIKTFQKFTIKMHALAHYMTNISNFLLVASPDFPAICTLRITFYKSNSGFGGFINNYVIFLHTMTKAKNLNNKYWHAVVVTFPRFLYLHTFYSLHSLTWNLSWISCVPLC